MSVVLLSTDLDQHHAITYDGSRYSQYRLICHLNHLYVTSIYDRDWEVKWSRLKHLHLTYPITMNDYWYVFSIRGLSELHPDRRLIALDDLERNQQPFPTFWENGYYVVRVRDQGLFTVTVDKLSKFDYTMQELITYSYWEFKLLYSPNEGAEVEFIIANLRRSPSPGRRLLDTRARGTHALRVYRKRSIHAPV